MSVASSIRTFFDELFSSRLTERLETDLIQLRQDMDERLMEKEKIIIELRAEKDLMQSKVSLMEMTLMPHASKQGADYVKSQAPKRPSFAGSGIDFTAPPPVSRWEKIVNEHEAQLAVEEAEEKNKPQAAAV